MEDFLNIINTLGLGEPAGELAEKLHLILLFGTLIVALLQCYFGFRLLRFFIALTGFLLGAAAGVILALRFLPDRSAAIYAGAGLAFGILIAVISYKIYLLGVFLLCGAVSAYAVFLLINGLGLPDAAVYAVSAVVFLVVGILSVRNSKTAVILITSVTGAFSGINVLMELVPFLSSGPLVAAIAFALLAGSGILLQYLMNLDKKV